MTSLPITCHQEEGTAASTLGGTAPGGVVCMEIQPNHVTPPSAMT